jgi:predicted TIM-barrel fold metal-dependent hydrolase
VTLIDAHISIAPPVQPSTGIVKTLLPAASPREVVSTLDRFGIDKACAIAPRVNGQDAYDLNYSMGNRAVYEVVRAYPDRVIGFARIYPSGFVDCTNELIRCKDEYGFKGLWLNGDRDFFFSGGAQTDPYVGLAQAWGWPVLFHIGTWPLAQPSALAQLAKRFPKLTIVGAHLGYDMINDAIAVAEEYPNVYLETSANATASAIKEVVKRVGAGKLIYGSGLPYAFPDHIYDKVRKLPGLSTSDRDAILGGTISRILRLN